MPVALAKRTYTLTRAAATTGVTAVVSLTGLGLTGNIVKFQVREDLTDNKGDEGVLYIADSTLSNVAAIPATDLVYQSGTLTLTPSATAATADTDLAVAALPKGEPYVLKDAGTPLNAILNVTSTRGGGATATTIYLTIWAEVRS